MVNETPRVDLIILLVVNNLGNGSLIMLILAETLNGLDAVHKEEATFFVGSPILLQVYSLTFA